MSSIVAENNLSPKEIGNRLISFGEKFVNNHVFKTYLENPIFNTSAIKYILCEYNEENLEYPLFKDLQVEHIFSKEPDYDIPSYGFAEDYEVEKNRVGNLTLLESTLNKGLQNHAPINKVSGYLNSIIKDTRNLAGQIQNENFSKIHVDERRDNIILFCIDRFKYEIPS